MKKINPESLPVMKSTCKTCPFREMENKSWLNVELANEVISRTLFKGQQICHGTEGENREPKNRCKGSFDYNDTIYKRMGFDFDELRKQNKK